MGYGDKSDVEEIKVEYGGESVVTKCILYEGYANEPEIDVNTYYTDSTEEIGSHKRATFRVTSLEDRKCAFRKAEGDRSEPTRIELLALVKYGWTCTNFNVNDILEQSVGSIRPTLSHVDDTLGAVMSKNNTVLTNSHPIFADFVELGQSGLALANAFFGYAEKLGLDSPDELFEDPARDVLRDILIGYAKNDEYFCEILLTYTDKYEELNISLTREEVENTNLTDLPPDVQAYVRGADWDEHGQSEINQQRLKALAEEAGTRPDQLKNELAIFNARLDTSIGHIELEYMRLKGSNESTPYVFNRNNSTFPINAEDAVQDIITSLNERLNRERDGTFAQSIEDAYDRLDEADA